MSRDLSSRSLLNPLCRTHWPSTTNHIQKILYATFGLGKFERKAHLSNSDKHLIKRYVHQGKQVGTRSNIIVPEKPSYLSIMQSSFYYNKSSSSLPRVSRTSRSVAPWGMEWSIRELEVEDEANNDNECVPYLYPGPDTLYDYRTFVCSTKEDCKPIATNLPKDAKVAVIGCGAAGITASYELMRAGVTPYIYEASDRVGGRLWSAKHPNDTQNLYELGGMRFPLSSRVFWDYCSKFGVEGQKEGEKFPNPGEVTTT